MLAATLLCFALLSFGQEESQGRRSQAPAQQPTPSPQTMASPSGSPSAQQRGPQERPTTPPEAMLRLSVPPWAQQRAPKDPPPPPDEKPPVVTKHEIRAGGKTLRYTA